MQASHLRTILLTAALGAAAAHCARPTDLPDERTPSDFADLYVAPPDRGGDDANPGDRSTAPLATLAAAVERAAGRAADDEPVEIAIVEGTYEETVLLAGVQNLALHGGYDNADPYLWTRTGDADGTTIAGVTGTALLALPGTAVTLERLTLIGGPGAPEEARIDDEELGLDLLGAGGLAVLGGTATVTDCVLDGGPGVSGEARAGAVAEDGASVTIEASTLRGGDNSSFPSGLFCGLDATCIVRRCPSIAGGIARRSLLQREPNQSAGISGLRAARIVAEDNEAITGNEGYASAGVWSWRTGEIELRNNALVQGSSAVEASGGLLIMHTPAVNVRGNGTIAGGSADASVGVQLMNCQGEVRDNLFIRGGAGSQLSVGLMVSDLSIVDVEANETVAGGTGFRTSGLYVHGAAARVRGNGIDGGQAQLGATGVLLGGATPPAARYETLLDGNQVFAGTAADTVIAMRIEAGAPLVLNNVLLSGSGLSSAYGVMFDTDSEPAFGFNTVAVLMPMQAKDAVTYAAGLIDNGSAAEVIGNLVVTNRWTYSALLWLPGGASARGTYTHNALYHWPVGGRGETTEYLLALGDSADPHESSLAYPDADSAVATLEALNGLDGVSATFLCNPAWTAPGLDQGASFDVHLGFSGCRDKGPDLADLAHLAVARGHQMEPGTFTDFEGDVRPQGEGTDPGADEFAVE